MGMLCQECKKHPASVHFTKVVNGKKDEIRLCEVCAKEKTHLHLFETNQSFLMHDLLAGLLHHESTYNENKTSNQKEYTVCSTCGISYDQFLQRGKFGCSDCYASFNDMLDPIFRRLQLGNTKHVGKIPSGISHIVHKKKELEGLRIQLKDRVENEEFEEAAVLRDQIKALEKEIEDVRKGGE